ncbi:MAG TPA: polysaccharide deacetylase family protein [Clostridia bacterium]|nr:polysaccharide deacetylase family protein [Clostridia bacterium]
MNKRRRWILILGALLLGSSLACKLLPDPSAYAGNTLSQWMVRLASSVLHSGLMSADFEVRDKQSTLTATQAVLHSPPFESRLGAITRGPMVRRRLAIVFTGHEFAEGAEVILSALQKHQAKASFFFTGDFLVNTNHQQLLRTLLQNGHYLGPHSDKHLLYCAWDASRKTLVPREEFKSDLVENLKKIQHLYDSLNIGSHSLAPRHGQPSTQSDSPPSNAYAADRFFLPPYEHYNEQIAGWTRDLGYTLINFTAGTRSNADYTGERDKNFVDSQTIFDSIVAREKKDPHGLNGFLLLLHIGAGPGRADKFHARFPELLDYLKARGYDLVRVDELLTGLRANGL